LSDDKEVVHNGHGGDTSVRMLAINCALFLEYVCQYTTPRCEHQKIKDNPHLLDYSVRNENSIQSIHM
jgi:hypothetical protein